MENKREFLVTTPMGVLRVYAKHDMDHPEDYPGVYIDLVKHGIDLADGDPVCTVEYDSSKKRIQTVAFDAEMDAPIAVTVYAESEEANADHPCGC